MSDAESLTSWTSLADKLLHLGYEVAGAAAPQVQNDDDHRGDIRLMAVCLIARSLSNMRGTLAMMRERRVVEARVLARCILENQFWTVGLADDPDKFRRFMIDGDLNKRGASAQTIFETGEIPDQAEKKLRQWMRDNKNWKISKSITPKQLAKDTQAGDAYVFYNSLSSDAHPTLKMLDRYSIADADNVITEIDLDPEPSAVELVETVALACFGLVNVLVSGCNILSSGATDKVDSLAREYLELMKGLVREEPSPPTTR